VKDKAILGLFVSPQIEGLSLGIVYAVTWGSVKVQAKMKPVLYTQVQGPIDLFEGFFFNIVDILRSELPGFSPVAVYPQPIIHWESYKIETPVTHPLKIQLPYGAVAAFAAAKGLKEIN